MYLTLISALAVAQPTEAVADYAAHCAACHGASRYGGTAPPLLPQALSRKTDEALVEVILNGRPNTQMPAFTDRLDEGRARALVALARSDAGEVTWGVDEIAQSLEVGAPDGPPLGEGVRRENVTLVVERGAGAVVVLDGDTLDELDRFPVGRVHGGPKFDADLSRVWAVTRDGAVVAYDLLAGGVVARAKVGVNTRNIAVRPGGDQVAAASQLPAQVAVLDGDLSPLAVIPLDGQPSGVYQEPGRDRFLLTLRDQPEMIFIDQRALTSESVTLPEPFEDFVFVPGRRQLLASARGGARVVLYDLDAGAVLAALETEALPHLFSACFFEREGALHAALNHIGAPKLTIVEVDGLVPVAEVPLPGSGYFARTHEGTPWIWVDTNTEQLALIDKATLAPRAAPLVPAPGKKAMHTEFTDDGARALVSVWDASGAVVVYDAVTAEPLERLPFAMPIGKYNAHNKTAGLKGAP